MSENDDLPRDSEPDGEESHSSEILADGLAGLINKPEVAKSISDFLSALAKNKSEEPKLAKHTFGWGLAFSAFVFAGIGLLGWFKVIGAEATTGLLGALIGYWYGRESKRQ